MYTLHTHIYIYIHTYVYIYITNITKYDKDMTCIGPQISQHRFRRSEWGIRRMVPRWRSGAACDLVNMKNSWYSSYGCSSPISTVQQILTEDDMFSWLSTPLQGLEINLGTSVTHLSPLHSLHLVSMSLEL